MGHEGSFHGAMESLHHAIGLRMIGCSAVCLRARSWSQSSDMNWGPWSEVSSPGMPNREIHSQKSALAHVDAVKSDMGMGSISPTGESVDDGEEIGKALRGWKGAYNVHMEMVETVVRLHKGLQGGASMLANLALMTNL